jgi:hypothetical protein
LKITSEQHEVHKAALQALGLEHGDTAEVAVVGVVETDEHDGAHLAHCPVAMRLLRIISRGTPEERAQPIQGRVVYKKADRFAKAIGRRRGFSFYTAKVHTNGDMVNNPDIGSVRNFEAQPWDKCRTKDGKARAEEILALCLQS